MKSKLTFTLLFLINQLMTDLLNLYIILFNLILSHSHTHTHIYINNFILLSINLLSNVALNISDFFARDFHSSDQKAFCLHFRNEHYLMQAPK